MACDKFPNNDVHAVCVMLHMMSVITQLGGSALIEAAWRGHTEVVTQLVKAKAKLDLQNQVCDDDAVVHS